MIDGQHSAPDSEVISTDLGQHHFSSSSARAINKELIVRRLSRDADKENLSLAELAAIDAIVARKRKLAANNKLLGEDVPYARPRFLLSGWACQQFVLRDGRRLIFGFLIPGDIIACDHERWTIGDVVSLTPVSICDFPDLVASSPGSAFARALIAAKNERERLLAQQVLRLGGMDAKQRTAHLLLALCHRFAAVGLFDGARLPFPLTQTTLGDALSMSAVHANRTLQYLRREKVILGASRNSLQVDVQALLVFLLVRGLKAVIRTTA